jgi:hypothetical protein
LRLVVAGFPGWMETTCRRAGITVQVGEHLGQRDDLRGKQIEKLGAVAGTPIGGAG